MAKGKQSRAASGGKAQVFDRTPPQSIEAERSVLGAMLLNPDAVAAAVEILGEDLDTFYVEAHRHIYEAVLELFRRNTPVDPTTLVEQLNRLEALDAAGGPAYIADLAGAVPTSANVEYYARIVLDAALLRRLIAACTQVVGEAYHAESDVDTLLDNAEAQIFAIAERKQINPIYKVSTLLEAGIHRIEAQIRSSTGITGVASGIPELDNLLSGFQPSDMIVLAARPSVGKTALALNIAAHVANHLHKGVLMFSIEMSKEQLVQRLLCMVGQVDSQRLRTGYLAGKEFSKIQKAADILSRALIYIDESPSLTALELRSKARRHIARHPVDLIIIDYLQLMTTGRRAENRQVEIAEISRSIKGLARELRVPVLALSQLSREAEKDDTGMPKLSHLRESGAIEQDADVVLMLSKLKEKGEEEFGNRIRLAVEKQRNGPTGRFDMIFDKNYQRFGSLVKGPVAAAPPPPEAIYEPLGEDYFEEDDAQF